MKKEFFGAALALCMAGAACAAKAPPPMRKDAYEAARARITAQAKADRRSCEAMKDQARDLCQAQAAGKEKTARAQLEARYRPSAEAVKQAKNVAADANFEVAKVKCEALKGKAEDHCMQDARAARDAAVRQAKVEKVESTGGIYGAHSERGAKAGKS
jgi:hypothetical protein